MFSLCTKNLLRIVTCDFHQLSRSYVSNPINFLLCVSLTDLSLFIHKVILKHYA